MRIVYESRLVTEYEDGTEDVRFTDDEYAAMALRPRFFGLVLQCGHALGLYNAAEGCNACLSIAEAYDEESAAAIAASYPRAAADVEAL